MHRLSIASSLVVLTACGASSPPPAPPIDNRPPPADPVTIPHQATRTQLRELIEAGALARIDLKVVEEAREYGDVDGNVEGAPGLMKVTICWERSHVLLEDESGRVHLVIAADDELARAPAAGGALLGLRVAPSCTITSYELSDGQRAGWHIELLEEP